MLIAGDDQQLHRARRRQCVRSVAARVHEFERGRPGSNKFPPMPSFSDEKNSGSVGCRSMLTRRLKQDCDSNFLLTTMLEARHQLTRFLINWRISQSICRTDERLIGMRWAMCSQFADSKFSQEWDISSGRPSNNLAMISNVFILFIYLSIARLRWSLWPSDGRCTLIESCQRNSKLNGATLAVLVCRHITFFLLYSSRQLGILFAASTCQLILKYSPSLRETIDLYLKISFC